MLTATEFLNAVADQGLVPDATLALLDKKLLASSGSLTAESLAKFLVGSKAITQAQADQLLGTSEEPLVASSSAVPEEPEEGSPWPLSSPSSVVMPKVVQDGDPNASLVSQMKPTQPAARRHKHLKKAKGNEFDSPLILLGGGGLAILVLIGASLAVLLNRESGDELLRSAQSSYESGSFSQAITEYQKFTEDFSAHAGWSKARVQLVVAKLRQAVDTSRDYRLGLREAERLIPEIEDEAGFGSGQGDFATLLPRIAEGLATQAEAASEANDAEKTAEGVKRTTAALALVGNTKYVPKSLRDEVQIATIQQTLERIERRQASLVDLNTTLEAMRQATDSASPRDAYRYHAELIAERPELAGNVQLTAAIEAATVAEQGTIHFLADPLSAFSEEVETPIDRAIGVVHQRGPGKADAQGELLTLHAGVAYALGADDGRLLWRRVLGVGPSRIEPIPIDDGYLLIDQRRNELLRVQASDGALVWRAPIDPDSHQPVRDGDRVLVPSESGKLLLLDAGSGDRLGQVVLAQALRTPPSSNAEAGRFYLVGEHSSLYTLDTKTLDCLGVYHLGHRSGSILLAPVVIEGKLIVLENIGLDTSLLRVLKLDPQGLATEEIATERLTGTCDTPPVTWGRRLAVATNRGEIRLYEASASGSDRKPLSMLALRPPGRQKRGPRYLAESDGAIWVADHRLTRSVASLSDSRLVVQRIEESFGGALFTGPLTVRNEALVHTRRDKNQPYITATATHLETGKTLWQTDLALPPIAEPIVSAKLRGLLLADRLGGLSLINREAIQRRSVSQPIIRARAKGPWTALLPLERNRLLLTSVRQPQAVLLDPTQSNRPRHTKLPGELACEPVAMGAGWLAPLRIGQVLLLDSAGNPLATPFQPLLTPGKRTAWLKPGVGSLDGVEHTVLADPAGTLYVLKLNTDAPASLELVASRSLQTTLPSSGAVLAGTHAVVGAAGDQLAVLPLPGLEGLETVSLGGDITWGPHAVGKTVLVSTAKRLLAVDPATASFLWKIPLTHGHPVGKPLVEPMGCTVAFERGAVVTFDTVSGSASQPVLVGQDLATGVTPYGKRLLLATQDSALLVIRRP